MCANCRRTHTCMRRRRATPTFLHAQGRTRTHTLIHTLTPHTSHATGATGRPRGVGGPDAGAARAPGAGRAGAAACHQEEEEEEEEGLAGQTEDGALPGPWQQESHARQQGPCRAHLPRQWHSTQIHRPPCAAHRPHPPPHTHTCPSPLPPAVRLPPFVLQESGLAREVQELETRLKYNEAAAKVRYNFTGVLRYTRRAVLQHIALQST